MTTDWPKEKRIKLENGNSLVVHDSGLYTVINEVDDRGSVIRRYLSTTAWLSMKQVQELLGLKSVATVQWWVRNGEDPEYTGRSYIPPEKVIRVGERGILINADFIQEVKRKRDARKASK